MNNLYSTKRDNVIKSLKRHSQQYSDCHLCAYYKEKDCSAKLCADALEILYKQSTTEPTPILTANWIYKDTQIAYDLAGVKTWGLKLQCSNCGTIHTFIEAHMSYTYCPNCGAKMDGGNGDG